jgi:hypothetical protein
MKKKMRVIHRPERDRAIFKVMRALAGLSASQISRGAAQAGSRISPTTIYNWRKPVENGGVRYPQFYTLNAAAGVAGLTFALVSVADSSHLEAVAVEERRKAQALNKKFEERAEVVARGVLELKRRRNGKEARA